MSIKICTKTCEKKWLNGKANYSTSYQHASVSELWSTLTSMYLYTEFCCMILLAVL